MSPAVPIMRRWGNSSASAGNLAVHKRLARFARTYFMTLSAAPLGG